MPLADEHRALAEELGRRCREKGLWITTAESCTGGLVAAAITAIAGSSEWFERGFVTYSNDAKREMLGVAATLIDAQGAVSETVACAMAAGALAHSRADCAVSVTGVAGPGGGSPTKPVGLVCFAWQFRGEPPRVQTRHLPGDRAAVREASVSIALHGLVDCLRLAVNQGPAGSS